MDTGTTTMIEPMFAAPLLRGEASGFFASGGFSFLTADKQPPRSPAAARQAHAPLDRGAAGSAVQPIRWLGDRLELLDQRLLPEKTVYVTCRTADEVAKAIRDMVVRGAPAIGCAAAFGVVLDKGSQHAFDVLSKSRPTAVNLFWALERMKKATDLAAEAKAIFAEDLAADAGLVRTRESVEVLYARSRVALVVRAPGATFWLAKPA